MTIRSRFMSRPMSYPYLIGLALLGSACTPSEPNSFKVRNFASAPERVQSCSDYNVLRNAYFGDLHVHTSFSSDAYTQGMRATPFDAYRFAFSVKPKTDSAKPDLRDPQISQAINGTLRRPLDFMSVTDHAEFLGETSICAAGQSTAKFCKIMQGGNSHSPYMLKFIMSPITWRDDELCGKDGSICRKALASAWHKTIKAAELWNDNSDACERVTFVGFEYSSHRLGSNLHRNVIFRNAQVTENPISYIDANREWDLWKILDNQCLDGHADCDALSIPHNSNLSNGRMFAVDYPNTLTKAAQRKRAQLRAKLEPIVEIMQHKGDSECYNGLSDVGGGEDELCVFEKSEHTIWRRSNGDVAADQCYNGPLADWVPHLGPNCLSSLSYVRYGLIQGLDEWRRLGVNPFQFGIIAATDTHNATGGATEEYEFRGHLGNIDNTAEKRLNRLQGAASVGDNPGGLVGVWSPQNTRADLFLSMKSREVFGTSGPRIRPRFFGGWQYSKNLCTDEKWLEQAYKQGVPMGQQLADMSKPKQAPVFIVQALPDSGTVEHAGTPLQKLQIIKGWVDDKGIKQQRIYDVGSRDQLKGADQNTCALPEDVAPLSAMCAVWRDPNFQGDRASVYYARVVQVPTCRYTHYQCNMLPEDEKARICSGDERIAPKMVRERAWTSPIWYTPASR